MNQIEALKILGIDLISESEEVIENKIFELKHEIIASCHVPQLILTKQKKLKQIVTICETLNLILEKEIEKFEIERLNSLSIIDSFNLYHRNRAHILREILTSNKLHSLTFYCDLLMENMKMWSQKWPKLDTHYILDMKLSKELESVEMFRVIKNLNDNNIIYFNDINSENIPMNLLTEIHRLNKLSVFFEKEH